MTDRLITDRELAEAMLASETSVHWGANGHANSSESGLSSPSTLAGGEAVLQRLQTHLLGWFGPDGVDALLIRALVRASVSHPILAGVQRPRSGALRLEGLAAQNGGPRAAGSGPGEDEVNGAIVALVAAILELIGRLVGDDMMRHLVTQIWPQLALEKTVQDDGPNNKRGLASE